MIGQELDRVRAVRVGTLNLVRDLPQDGFDQPPAAGKWAVGEILDHLILADRFYVSELQELITLARSGRPPYLRRTFREVDVSIGFFPKSLLPVVELPASFFSAFLPAPVKMWLGSNRLIPVKNPDFATPRRCRRAEDLRRDLEESLEALARLIETNSDLDYRAMRHQHPLLGFNDGPELLRFIATHEERHQAQIREAMENYTIRAAWQVS